MWSSNNNKKNKLTKLLTDNYFDQNSSENIFLMKLGESFLNTITLNLLLQSDWIKKNKKNKNIQTPNIINPIIDSLSIEVSRDHLLMSFGKLYNQKDFISINAIQKELKEIVQKQFKTKSLNVTVSTNYENQNSRIQKSPRCQNTSNTKSFSEYSSSVKSYISSMIYGVAQKQNNTSTQKQKQKNNSLNLSSILKGIEQNESNEVIQYLNEIQNFTVQIELLKNFKPNDFILQNHPKQINQNQFEHVTLFKGRFIDTQFEYEDKGKGKNKKQAKENANRQLLRKIFNQNQQLFKHFRDYKEKKLGRKVI